MTIDTREIDRYFKAAAMALSEEKQIEIMAKVGQTMGVSAEQLPPYPWPSRKRQAFGSERQRRYFFAALKAGRIQVPYRRTGQLQRSIMSQVVSVTKTKVTVQVGPRGNVPYALYVIGNKEQQSAYHKDHWWQMEADIERRLDRIRENALDKYTDLVRIELEK